LGYNSYYTVYKTKELRKCWPNVAPPDKEFWVNDKYSFLGGETIRVKKKGFFSKEMREVTTLKKDTEIAKKQINEKINEEGNKLNSYKYFYFKSLYRGGWKIYFEKDKDDDDDNDGED